MKRVALFFGSFNPVHKGHLHIASAVLEKGLADEVEFVLTPHNPFKKLANLWPEADRWKMLEIALAKFPNMHPNDIELELPKPNYTATTLKRLGELYPNKEYSLLLGADTAVSLPTWTQAEYIQQFPLLIYPRAGSPIPPFSKGRLLIDVELQEISASEIRTTTDQELLRTWLPEGVHTYLAKNNWVIDI